MLSKRLKSLPDTPGVYLMKDKDDRIIYVGKAISLKKRISSYFQKQPSSPKERILVSKIADFEYIATGSGLEALILECNLIKQHRPRYNVRLKDDKRYPLVKITTDEEFPRLLFVRRRADDGAAYFGPYTESQNLRKNIRCIREIFPICTCKQKIKPGKKKRPCLDFSMGRCCAPCTESVDVKIYRELANGVILFLRGRHGELIKGLRKKMKVLSGNLRFEEAARIRDEIRAIENLTVKQRVVSSENVNRDVIALSLRERRACAIVLNIREGRLLGQKHFFLERFIEDSPFLLMNAFIKQYYFEVDFIPPEIIVEGEVPDREIVGEWLSERAKRRVRIHFPKRGEKLRLIELAKKNAELILAQKGEPGTPLDELKDFLHLPGTLRRIEAFDISNIRGKLATASLVVFEDGRPKKESYRRFKIKSLDSSNDVGMIKEVIGRHFARLLSEKESLPDLVLIDGGKPQINAAYSILAELGLEEIPLIGLAKVRREEGKEEERIFTLNRKVPLKLARDSAGLRLLQHIRDEAHRFAISYHKKLRKIWFF